MQYNQPWGVSDPNAAYINGNVATGQRGSIPPAESVEYDQRELVALIAATGQTPTNSDLAQLLKAIKLVDICNKFKAGVNQGTSTQWSVAIASLPVSPLPAGSAIWVRPVYPSQTGGTSLSVNGGSYYPVVLADLSPITLGDILPNGWVLCLFDGANWQVIAGCVGRVPGQLPALHANANWYVNGTTGLDTYDGSSATVVNATIGPFKTIQRAADETKKYNMNGYDQNIFVADGNYAGAILPVTNGAGTCRLIGNIGVPQNVVVSGSTNSPTIYQTAGQWSVNGFRLSNSNSGGAAHGFVVASGGIVTLSDLSFGSCGASHLGGAFGSQMTISGGRVIIESGAHALSHLFGENTAVIHYNSAALTALEIQGSVNFTNGFVDATLSAIVQMTYSSITGKTSAHGRMYHSDGNSVIASLGGGPNAFPGDVAGLLTFGGQYLP